MSKRYGGHLRGGRRSADPRGPGAAAANAPLWAKAGGGAGLERGSGACYADPAAPPEPRDTREAPSGPRGGRPRPHTRVPAPAGRRPDSRPALL